jgi:signal transduction histidine kinase
LETVFRLRQYFAYVNAVPAAMENELSLSDPNHLVPVGNAGELMQQALLEKALAQGKFEMACDTLHDIGNALVGFGAYLTRIRRSLEQNNVQNLENLTGFFKTQETAMAAVIGEPKSQAVISLLLSMADVQRKSHEEVQQSIKEQLKLITHVQEILSMQRQYVTGREAQDKKATNLRSVVGDCIAMLSASLEKRAILVLQDMHVETPVIFGDRTRLMQVMLNILKNSIEAIALDSPTKTISIRLARTDVALVVEIQDSGDGFDEASAGRLFERGFTTKTSGTGLGLQNCRAILRDHGGSITINSEGVGKGALTTIIFNQPANAA